MGNGIVDPSSDLELSSYLSTRQASFILSNKLNVTNHDNVFKFRLEKQKKNFLLSRQSCTMERFLNTELNCVFVMHGYITHMPFAFTQSALYLVGIVILKNKIIWWLIGWWSNDIILAWIPFCILFKTSYCLGSVSLFNGISTFVGHLMPKPPLLKNSSDSI